MKALKRNKEKAILKAMDILLDAGFLLDGGETKKISINIQYDEMYILGRASPMLLPRFTSNLFFVIPEDFLVEE